jgi:hypothetical protein
VIRDGIREGRAPAGIEIAAGEYGYDLFYFRRMLEAGAVDVLHGNLFPDRSRPGLGIEFKRADAERWRVV